MISFPYYHLSRNSLGHYIDAKAELQFDALEMLKVLPIEDLLWLDYAICVFAGRCDLAGVLNEIEEMFRCGLCSAACCGIDHVTAITAKKQALQLRIVETGEIIKSLRAQLAPGEAPPASLVQLESQRALDVKEALGYAERERTLLALAANYHSSGQHDERLFSTNPEFVIKKLKLITKPTAESEYVLHRVADASIYNSLQTPEIRMKANQLHQRLLAGIGDTKSLLEISKPGTEIEKLLSLIKLRGKALGLDNLSTDLLERISNLLSDHTAKIKAEK